MSNLSWWLNNWGVVFYITLWFIVVVFIWIRFGWNIALAIGSAGLMAFIYKKGRSDEKNHNEQHVKEVIEDRKKAYEEIDNRNINGSDVRKRLRDGSY